MKWILALSVLLAMAGVFCSAISVYYLRELKRLMKKPKTIINFRVEDNLENPIPQPDQDKRSLK